MMRKRLFYRPLQARTPESAKKHFQGFFTDQRYFFRLLVLKQIGYSTILPFYHLMYILCNFPLLILSIVYLFVYGVVSKQAKKRKGAKA